MEPGAITLLLRRVKRGEADATNELFQLVYDHLRKVAGAQMRRAGANHTLTPTALVNEVYIKLIDRIPENLGNRAHFFGIAARAMRQVLIDHAERKAAAKRGGDVENVTIEDSLLGRTSTFEQLLELDDALKRLEQHDPRSAQIVEYRFFAGLTQEEIGKLMDISVPTIGREWRAARAWLRNALQSGTDE